MSISSFRRNIAQATADRRLEVGEARALVEAVGPSVTAAEAKALGDLYARLTTARTAPAPQVYATQGALGHLAAFFKQAGLPVGPNQTAMQQQLWTALEFASLGPARRTAPRTASLLEVGLHDARAADGQRHTAFVNPGQKQVYVRVDGGGRANAAARWYGPWDLDALPASRVRQPQSGQVTAGLLNRARDSLREELEHGLEFNQQTLGAGKFAQLGTLLADGRGVFTVYVPDSPNLDRASEYVVRRTRDGVDSWSTVRPLVTPPDAGTDGKLSAGMKTRARNIYFHLEHTETWNWKSSGPPRSQTLVFAALGGSVPTGAFVVGKNPDGTPKDPDTATQVWFRHGPSGKWSGPHDL